MITLNAHTVLIAVGLLSFALATFGAKTNGINTTALGLLCWLASTLV